MKKIVINKQLVNYLSYLSDNLNPVILLLHGWRVDGLIWGDIINLMRKNGIDNNIYALDFPGFGQSPAPSKDFNLSDYCSIVEGFIQKLNLGKVIVIGHSFGGRVAIKLSLSKPDLISKLILVDSAGVVTHQNKKRAMNLVAKIVKPFFSFKAARPLREAIYKQIGAEDYLATPALQKTYVNIINEDLTGYLHKISQPTLLIWGSTDRDTPVADAMVMSEKIPNSKMVVIEGAGHFSFRDKPQEFVKNLKEFINV